MGFGIVTTVFLSSTWKDLEDYRKWVREIIIGSGWIYKGMENNSPVARRRIDQCKVDITQSDLIICIIGSSYGTIPDGEIYSFTDIEIKHAIENKKNMLGLFLDDRHILSQNMEDGCRLELWREMRKKVEGHCGPSIFHNMETFLASVAVGLAAWTQDHEGKKFKGKPQKRGPEVSVPQPEASGAGNEVVKMSMQTKKNYRESAYDQIADWYDYWYAGHWESNEPATTIHNLIQGYFPNERTASQIHILDCACGTGNPFVALTRLQYKVSGSDGSREMLRRAVANCTNASISSDGIIREPLNWTNAEGYAHCFKDSSLDVIVNTGNSFCHLPPNDYMEAALENFYRLLKRDGILIIDTKRFRAFEENGVAYLKELRFDSSKREWSQRFEREESVEIPGLGKIRFHTRMFYDVDPEFSFICRAFILLTICGQGRVTETGFVSQTVAIPYYPLPADALKAKMQRVGFKVHMFNAGEGPLDNWKYDVVVGQK